MQPIWRGGKRDTCVDSFAEMLPRACMPRRQHTISRGVTDHKLPMRHRTTHKSSTLLQTQSIHTARKVRPRIFYKTVLPIPVTMNYKVEHYWMFVSENGSLARTWPLRVPALPYLYS